MIRSEKNPSANMVALQNNVRFETVGGRLLAEAHNLTTDAGEIFAANRWATSKQDPLSYMAIGTGTTAPTKADKALRNEVYRDAFTGVETTANGSAVMSMLVGSGQANGYPVSEAGLFNAEEGGTMFARVVLDAAQQVSKVEGIALNIIWQIDVLNA